MDHIITLTRYANLDHIMTNSACNYVTGLRGYGDDIIDYRVASSMLI
jgi:hypothetical protein